jgi:hypothetical protein
MKGLSPAQVREIQVQIADLRRRLERLARRIERGNSQKG